ncbi:hypothetical protein GCM10028812_51080 [Ancylobacter sonchi]
MAPVLLQSLRGTHLRRRGAAAARCHSARTLAEKSLAQNIGQPTLIALAHTIEQHRKAYYDQLEVHRTLAVTDWLIYFAQTIIAAQQTTLDRVAFHIAKTHFYDRFRDRVKERQEKVIARLFREGPGGWSAPLEADSVTTGS